MNIDLFVGVFVDFISGLVDLLDNLYIVPLISYWDFILGCLCIGLITTVFWKGAKT